jgi:hypothetical protein
VIAAVKFAREHDVAASVRGTGQLRLVLPRTANTHYFQYTDQVPGVASSSKWRSGSRK